MLYATKYNTVVHNTLSIQEHVTYWVIFRMDFENVTAFQRRDICLVA